ncbi:MAG: hypothetical protein V7K53_27285 [Nostoc sp.]
MMWHSGGKYFWRTEAAISDRSLTNLRICSPGCFVRGGNFLCLCCL